ncbi:MAG: hypothetical protein IIC01_01210 [Planctomycetes bacterium]|nr:hypothetical protein [Planctomycetota bacterium]
MASGTVGSGRPLENGVALSFYYCISQASQSEPQASACAMTRAPVTTDHLRGFAQAEACGSARTHHPALIKRGSFVIVRL